MDVLSVLLGVLLMVTLGIVTAALTLMVILPLFGVAGYFVNDPPTSGRSGLHFFTGLEPSQMKNIERKGKFVRAIGATPDRIYAREGAFDSPSYWTLKEAKGESNDPIADVWWPIRWWARLVYNMTGLVFTGIYPFQRVREYPLQRTKLDRREEGRREGESNLSLTVETDMSDHFRAQMFQFPMHITAAETRDAIPLDFIGVAELEVVNPFVAAYGVDRWDLAITNLVTEKLVETNKVLRIDRALTSDDLDARPFVDAVMSIKDDVEKCGIQICTFRLLEVNPIIKEDDRAKLQAEGFAIQLGKATRIDGQARADAIRSINEATKTGGDTAITTMENEAFVRAAEAAGKSGGEVILMPPRRGSDVDPTNAAILAELKKLNRRNIK